jgi:hypothetical protein
MDFKRMNTTDDNAALDAFDRAIKYRMKRGIVPLCTNPLTHIVLDS